MTPAVWVGVLAGVGAVAWWTAERRRGAGLAVYPQGALCAVAAQIAVLAHGTVRTAGLATALVLGSWMSGSRLGRRQRPAARAELVVASSPTAPGWVPVPQRRSLGDGTWIVDFARCRRCDSVLVGEARLDTDPAGVVARSVCDGCGARLVGVADPGSSGRLVWFEQPADRQDIA